MPRNTAQILRGQDEFGTVDTFNVEHPGLWMVHDG